MNKKHFKIVLIILLLLNIIQAFRGYILSNEIKQMEITRLSKVIRNLESCKNLVDNHRKLDRESIFYDGRIVAILSNSASAYKTRIKDSKVVQLTNDISRDIIISEDMIRYFSSLRSKGSLNENTELREEYLRFDEELSEVLAIAIENLMIPLGRINSKLDEPEYNEVLKKYREFKEDTEFFKGRYRK